MKALVPARNIQNLIFEFRGMKVMIDADLAALYETSTRRLREQVRRNKMRFPKDFMFVLRNEEKTQLILDNRRFENLKHSRSQPMVFTEQGVAMLSSVLNSRKAVMMNIEIMRAFAQYRALLLENHGLRTEIKALDQKLNNAFKYLLEKIDALTPALTERKRIGYRTSRDDD